MLSHEEIDLFMDVSNPLDCAEDILINRDWVFERLNEDELTVSVSGRHGLYSMTFIWQDDINALQFKSIMSDIAVPDHKMNQAYKVLSTLNSSLWLGHFSFEHDTTTSDMYPCFRHTSLLRGMTEGSGAPFIEDLIQIAVAECDRYYMTFDLLSKTASQDNDQLALAMMDSVGAA